LKLLDPYGVYLVISNTSSYLNNSQFSKGQLRITTNASKESWAAACCILITVYYCILLYPNLFSEKKNRNIGYTSKDK